MRIYTFVFNNSKILNSKAMKVMELETPSYPSTHWLCPIVYKVSWNMCSGYKELLLQNVYHYIQYHGQNPKFKGGRGQYFFSTILCSQGMCAFKTLLLEFPQFL